MALLHADAGIAVSFPKDDLDFAIAFRQRHIFIVFDCLAVNLQRNAVVACECGRNTKYQIGCWDNGSVRDLRLRRWKP